MRRRRKGADVNKPYGLQKRNITRWIRRKQQLSLNNQIREYKAEQLEQNDDTKHPVHQV
jgi:hypothetical protein